MEDHFSSLILAAGKGVRMKSTLPKVLHPLLGKPMIKYVIDTLKKIGSSEISLVVGYGKNELIAALDGLGLSFVEQPEQLGTGHAVQCYAKSCVRPPQNLLIVCGDTPLLSSTTLRKLVDHHFLNKNALTMMTVEMAEPGSYGRIIRDDKGRICAIRENKDCTEKEKKIKEVNLGIYVFSRERLFETLPLLTNNNRQKEYYLTDLVEIFYKKGWQIETIIETDEESTIGINSRCDLAKAASILNRRIQTFHMENGVSIIDPSQTLIEPDVVIEADTEIWPGTVITGKSVIGKGSVIGPNTFLKTVKVGAYSKIRCCCLENVDIPENTELKPFSTGFIEE